MLLVWVQFVVAALIILLSGAKLSRLGDVIEEKTGIGHIWIGAFLLAIVTSLPEVVTSSFAVVTQHSVDLALGNIFGSIFLNIFLLVVLDFLVEKEPILHRVSLKLILPIASTALLITVTLFFFSFEFPFRIGRIGVDSLVIFLLYLFFMFLIFRHKGDRYFTHLSDVASKKSKKYESIPFSRAILLFLIFSALIFVGGFWITRVAVQIAELYGWSHSFVGTLFLAFVTSLPEFTVSFRAAQLGLYDMAVGNLFGSCMFNLIIIFFCDLLFGMGPIFNFAASDHLLTIILCLIVSLIALVGLVYKSKVAVLRIGLDSLSIGIIYIVGMYFLFRF